MAITDQFRRWFHPGSATLRRQLIALLLVMLGLGVTAVVSFLIIPMQNTDATHFDTLIVLGAPARMDGKPSAIQRERVMEGVREFRAGRAGHIIMSGGAAHNRWVEAEVMAKLAESEGVPAENVEVEGKAINTVENVFYSDRIMQAKGWTSAEVVSSKSHLPRAALILQHYSFAWRLRGAPWPPKRYGPIRLAGVYGLEVLKVMWVRCFGLGNARVLHSV